jgi:hypothetical protein
MKRARVTDWGSYVRWDGKVIIPFKRLLELGLCDVFITKGGQSGPGLSTKANLAAARAEKVPVTGCFYWGDPCNAVEFDVAMIDGLIIQEDPDIVILDFEQWWSDWAKYEAACSGLIGWGDVPHFSPFVLSEHYRKVAEQIQADNPSKKVLIYTSKPFVNSWADPMSTWLNKFDGGFVASWPDYGRSIYYLDWPDIQSYPAEDEVPDLPPPWTTWKLWQTSSRIRPQQYQFDFESGFDHNYDWGLFNGSLAELLAWLGKPAPEPEPYPNPIPEPAPIAAWQQQIDAWARTKGFSGSPLP